ncbi:hypothetical protein V4V60_003607 [Vibrio mimicus]
MIVKSPQLRHRLNFNVSSSEINEYIARDSPDSISVKRIKKTLNRTNNNEKISKLNDLLKIIRNTVNLAEVKKKPQPYETIALYLSKKHDINIIPLFHNEQFIGYLFHGKDSSHNRVMISSHGSARNQIHTFIKNEDIILNFACTSNSVLSSSTMTFVEKLRQKEVHYNYDTQVYGPLKRRATNYFLSGGIRTTPDQAAKLVSETYKDKNTMKFDMVLLDNCTSNILFSDLIDSIQQYRNTYKTFDCHFCRPKNMDAKIFSAQENYKKNNNHPIYYNIRTSVDILDKRPNPDYTKPAIWESITHPGTVGLFIPGNKPKYLRAKSEQQASDIFHQHGITWLG